MIWKISRFVKIEILVVFVNTLTADERYPVRGYENLQFLFKCNYLKNKNHFVKFYFHYSNLHQIWNILKKKMIVIANVFPLLQIVKNLVKPLFKRRPFGTSFESQHIKHLWNLHDSTFIKFFHHSEGKWFEKYLS